MADLKVFYGTKSRWDQRELERAQAIVGHECHAFDALEAGFEVDATRVEGLVRLLELAGFPAESVVQGRKIGSGCPKEALERERRQMRKSYLSEMR